MTVLLMQLFATFFVIGLFTFGGGGAMLSLIQGEVVTAHGWISDAMFTDIVAISQTTPGPIGINCATYVGYEVLASYGKLAGILGSAVATFALVLPSFIVFYLLVRLLQRYSSHPVYESAMSALKPAVAGLIGAAALLLTFRTGWDGWQLQISVLTDNFPDWKAWALGAAALIASLRFRVNPIILILCGAVAGLLIW
ncbi:MAG: chromate transporter [Bacteroidales bacterium]|nr:chromate transporter [Bacteroidales bacterium]